MIRLRRVKVCSMQTGKRNIRKMQTQSRLKHLRTIRRITRTITMINVWNRQCLWRVLLGIGFALPVWAQSQETITLNEGELEIPITRYEAFADHSPIVLWLPDTHGVSPKQSITATALGDMDIETWVVDLHLAYFVDAGRSSVKEFVPQDIAQLIKLAAKRSGREVYLMATGRVAKPALEAVALIQQQAQKNNAASNIGGLILFHPYLTLPVSEPGTKAPFLPVAKNSTIPIYFVQPSISTSQWRSKDTVSMLQSNGSAVFFHAMPGVAAGYHLRPDEDMTELDYAQRDKLPKDIKAAINLLSIQAKPPAPKPVSLANTADIKKKYGLNQLENRSARSLALVNLKAKPTAVDYASKPVTLVSFWASWCGPCIKELPSLKRLHEDYADKGLYVVTINVGETADEINETIQEFGMQNYTNLLDPEGVEMKAWNVYGFPTNFIIDADGNLPYASFGGVDWDDTEVREVIGSFF